ncbi:SRPBCC domain-containing protein [Actinomycetospora lutea]|uniref:SRPBCC domain-containing protein n=1 Tax=Actinomycetospora lutea TaxID=663604 RepID=UPI002365C035|nr:SRPBCC domain-containing protein [Actinomycetospora lutea]MDD7937028.1 SRPBCC domain-containing protein [Actinomycetospora lutea]
MGFPDRIERTVELAHRPEVVWRALTTAEGLRSWLGDRAAIDLRPGGRAEVVWTGGEASGDTSGDTSRDASGDTSGDASGDTTAEIRVERVEEARVLGFTWRVDGVAREDPRRTYVDFTLEPTPTGTRLHLVESGFAQLSDDDHRAGYASHSDGWTHELGELVAYLDAA